MTARQSGRGRDGGAVTRRDTLALTAGVLAAAVVPPARAQAEADSHGMSAFGDLKYPADFKHFDFVDVNAPNHSKRKSR